MERIKSCEEAPHEIKIMIVKADLFLGQGHIRPVAIKNEENLYAGVIECRVSRLFECPFNRETCSLFKSAYIFDEDIDAITWAREEIANMGRNTSDEEKEMIAYLRSSRSLLAPNEGR